MKLIKADEVVSKRRGRTATYHVATLDALSQIVSGQFGVLDSEDLPQVKGEEALPATTKDSQSVVNGIIRKHFARVFPGTSCTIKWTVDGYPQVGAK